MQTKRTTQFSRVIATLGVVGALGLAPAAEAGQNRNNPASAAGNAVEALLNAANGNGGQGRQTGGPVGGQNQGGGVSHSQPGQTQQAKAGGGKFDRSQPRVHWRGQYAGSNDGRNAVLEIKPTGKVDYDTMSYSVILRDQDRGQAFQGTGYVDFKQGVGRPAHVMYFQRPLAGPSGRKTVERLFLHTWDTGFISGTTEWRGTSYGLAFKAR
jgi:hypothetical protein